MQTLKLLVFHFIERQLINTNGSSPWYCNTNHIMPQLAGLKQNQEVILILNYLIRKHKFFWLEDGLAFLPV